MDDYNADGTFTKEKRAQLVQRTLDQAQGTDRWHRHGMMRNLYFTDSVDLIARYAQAHWLIDAIASHIITNKKLRQEPFQVWTLIKNPLWGTEEEYQAALFSDPFWIDKNIVMNVLGRMERGETPDPKQPMFYLTCTDGDKGDGEITLVRQAIPFSDFPLDKMVLWCEQGYVQEMGDWVLMAPGDR